MFNKKRKVLYMVLTIIFAILFVIFIAATIVCNAFAPAVHAFFNTESSTTSGEKGEDFFKKDASSAEEQQSNAQAIVEEIAAEGSVLLMNDGALPLSEGSKVTLLGATAADIITGGTGSGSVAVTGKTNFKTALEQSGFEVNSTMWNFYTSGAGSQYKREDGSGALNNVLPDFTTFSINEVPQSAYTDAEWNSVKDYGDAAIVVLGRVCGEGFDLPWFNAGDGTGNILELTKEEQDLLAKAKQLKDAGTVKQIVVILNTSYALELDFLNPDICGTDYGIDACMWIGLPGESGLNGVADILAGIVNPSGKLVSTYTYDNLSSPAMQNMWVTPYTNASEQGLSYGGNGSLYNQYYIAYQEGIYVGYRYYETRYEDYVLGNSKVGDYNYSDTVAYSFGYGLSYSTFTYSDFEMTENEDSFTFTVTVKNTSDVAGKDVVAIYMQSPYTDYDRENKVEKASVELVGYTKVEVPANGQVENVTVTVDKTELRAYDAYGAQTYILDAGNYYFALGNGAHDALNNILAKKADISDTSNGTVDVSRMTSVGNQALVQKYTVDERDTEIFSTAVTGEKITNQFDDADLNRRDDDTSNDIVYVSRSDWQGTMPKATVTATSYTAAFNSLAANDDIASDLKATYKSSSGGTMPAMGADNGLKLIQFKSVEFDESITWNGKEYTWDDLLDQLTFNEMARLIGQGYHTTAYVGSVSKPETKDENGPSGITTSLSGGTAKGTCYPSADLRAATFNDELTYRMGVSLGNDALWSSPKVFSGLYGPGCNIQRTPYGGRNFEYYSEDPYIGGNICASEVKGIQSKGMYVYLKHFALNDQESGRDGISVWANEQSIREIYLQQFETVIEKADAHCVMSSFNRLGATWTGANANLMTNVLRGEWGMDGMAVTDYSGNDFMDVCLGLVAGQDIWDYSGTKWVDKLNTYKNDATIVNAMRQASARILYTVANSNAMNGYTVDTVVTGSLAWWQSALIAADVIFGVLALAAGALLVLTIFSNKKADSAEVK